jgi:hypothetical protein
LISAALLTAVATTVDVRPAAAQPAADPRDARILRQVIVGVEQRHRLPRHDPWWTYQIAQARNANALLEDLRRPFRASITP